MKKRYFLGAAGILFIFSLYLMSLNAGTAKSKAGEIVTKDTAGQDVTADLASLANYVHGHMNAAIALELTGSYQRAKTAAQAATAPDVNGTAYQQAQAACASKADSIRQAQCVQAYLSIHTQPAASSQPVAMPLESTFIHTYGAPRWTPDLAGLSLLAAVVLVAWTGWLAVVGRQPRY